jgi:hypothetical protein
MKKLKFLYRKIRYRNSVAAEMLELFRSTKEMRIKQSKTKLTNNYSALLEMIKRAAIEGRRIYRLDRRAAAHYNPYLNEIETMWILKRLKDDGFLVEHKENFEEVLIRW